MKKILVLFSCSLLFLLNTLSAQTDQYTLTLNAGGGGTVSNSNLAIKFGICTDVHVDIIYNPEDRMRIFVDDMKEKKSDFIIQLGDFCYPENKNKNFISIFEEFGENAYGVIGNHDQDNGASKEEVIAFYKMPAAYYSFDKKGFHFIVMDGNEGKNGDNPATISDAQKEWLINDLNNTHVKTIVFIHESLAYDEDISNREEIRNILSSQMLNNGNKKVVVCFNGHKHTDEAVRIDDIWYVTINSMSDIWVGEEYGHIIEGIPASVYEDKPDLKYVCPYTDPLYAFVTIFEDGTISIKGITSTWVDPSPMELGYNGGNLPPEKTPKISDRMIK